LIYFLIKFNIIFTLSNLLSAFPSKVFYKNQLKDGLNVKSAMYRKQYLGLGPLGKNHPKDPILRPFVFLNLLTSRERFGVDSDDQNKTSMSRSNLEEVKCCISMLNLVISEATLHGENISSIGIITPYQDQLSILKKEVRNAGFLLDSNTTPSIELNTVDGFQGQEKDVIIFSCVR